MSDYIEQVNAVRYDKMELLLEKWFALLVRVELAWNKGNGNKNVQNTGRGESRGRGLGNTFIKGFDLKEAPCELLYGFGFFWFDMKGATTGYCTVVWFLLVALKKAPTSQKMNSSICLTFSKLLCQSLRSQWKHKTLHL